jgi:hypothetical protein
MRDMWEHVYRKGYEEAFTVELQSIRYLESIRDRGVIEPVRWEVSMKAIDNKVALMREGG